MEMPIAAHDIDYAENLLAEGELETAAVLLEELASEAGEYADAACIATDARQWFSFSSPFEYLAYRRVERDPRELSQVEAPFDRLYADLAYIYIQRHEYESARDALKQAVRWNPMNCAHRLNLAEVFRALGDTQEWAALSASVLDRATTPQALARAFANLGQYFLAGENLAAAEGCRRAAICACDADAAATALAAQLDKEHPELGELSDEVVNKQLEEHGIGTGANAEIAVCLLMCATDAASEGDRNEATRLTLLARDLVGAPACEALIRLIRDSDAELAREREEVAAGQGAASAESDDDAATDTAPAASAGSAFSDSVDSKDGE